MFNYIFKIIKRIFFAIALLYSYDLLAPSKIFVSVNIYTLLIVTLFRFFGLIFLIIMKVFM